MCIVVLNKEGDFFLFSPCLLSFTAMICLCITDSTYGRTAEEPRRGLERGTPVTRGPAEQAVDVNKGAGDILAETETGDGGTLSTTAQ